MVYTILIIYYMFHRFNLIGKLFAINRVILWVMTKKINFLLADDDGDDREMFEEAFKKISPLGVLNIFTDGKKAVDYLSNCPDEELPCGFILDYNMPHMNGPQVLDWLCNQTRMIGINKFIWSTDSRKDYVDGCLGKGAIEYFVKPNTIDGLSAIVKKIVDYCDTVC